MEVIIYFTFAFCVPGIFFLALWLVKAVLLGRESELHFVSFIFFSFGGTLFSIMTIVAFLMSKKLSLVAAAYGRAIINIVNYLGELGW